MTSYLIELIEVFGNIFPLVSKTNECFYCFGVELYVCRAV